MREALSETPWLPIVRVRFRIPSVASKTPTPSSMACSTDTACLSPLLCTSHWLSLKPSHLAASYSRSPSFLLKSCASSTVRLRCSASVKPAPTLPREERPLLPRCSALRSQPVDWHLPFGLWGHSFLEGKDCGLSVSIFKQATLRISPLAFAGPASASCISLVMINTSPGITFFSPPASEA